MIRLQKYLADAGVDSRRKCEQLIIDGRVMVNGARATLGQSVAPGDKVTLNGKPVGSHSKPLYIALNKPPGYASDMGTAGARNIFALVNTRERLFAVGRLDMDSHGLVLLTNDGPLAFKLTHPSFEHEKQYHVWVRGVPLSSVLHRWQDGIQLADEDTPTLPCKVAIIDKRPGETLLSVTLREGRKRQIRRVAKFIGHPVQDLMRVRIGPISLGPLESGAWRALSVQELKRLRDYVK